ncbi:hypothetical protein [Marinicella litoralis]|uniref:Heat shock protein C n=1 Tax=Marinicella litoralis TaxID=644220 RepID=A0A4V3DIX3_9GAMM|nr:hypothetical protein [Marinicella litoralis]TDR23901.1 hypothetical protein C8D91_0769 [Marinicella litoralis]
MPSNRFFSLSDQEYQYWLPFQYKGVEYTFEHLNAKKITYNRRETGAKYKFFITFSHHVFTEGVKQQDLVDPNDLYSVKPNDVRLFDIDRYELSLMLPEIIENLPEKFCYHGHYGKYCTCEYEDANGNLRYYQVVFKAFRSQNKLRLHIESAYPLNVHPGSKGKIKKVNFWFICFNLAIGKKLPSPGF